MIEWKTIDSAPTDGSRIIVANEYGCWIAEFRSIAASGYFFDNPWRSMLLNHNHMNEINLAPTHWMHLPEPPRC